MSTRIHAKAADVAVDEFIFDDVTNGVDIEIENNLGEVTAFADTDATFVEGKPGFRITVNGFHSNTSPAYDSEMFTDLTSEDRRVGVYPGGVAAGQFGYEAQADIGSSPRIAEKAGALLLNVTWRGDTPLVRAISLYRATAVAATVNGTAYQRGAASASQTIVGVLRLIAAPGGAGNNTLDVTIQSASDEAFTTPNTRLTFAQLNQASVATHAVQTAAGAVTDTWWRAVITIAGAGTRTFNVLVTFGIRPT